MTAVFGRNGTGRIPSEWDMLPLGEVVQFISGKAHEPYVSRFGRFVVVNSKFISTDGLVRKYCTVNLTPARKGDVLMVMSDLPNGRALAKCYLVDEDDKYAVNQRVCIFRSRSHDPRYLKYALNRNPYFLSFNDGVQQTHLLNDPIKKCPLVLPPTSEQAAIADALTDVDVLIGTLGRLIAKKQAIKQGMMQRLLTGESRLPGFATKWERVRLGDVVTISRGASPRPIASPRWFSDSSSVGWVRISDLGRSDGMTLTSTTQRLSEEGIARSRFLPAGTLILSIAATVGVPIITGIDTCIHDGFVAIERLRGVNQTYLLFVLRSMGNELRAAGQTGSQANVNTAIVGNLLIWLPSESEQAKIGTALGDAEVELGILKRRLQKAIRIKQGMQQQLLTGRMRLPFKVSQHE